MLRTPSLESLAISQSFAFVRGEGTDVDKPDYIVGVGGGVGDDRTAVGVADGKNWAWNLLEKARDVGGVDCNSA